MCTLHYTAHTFNKHHLISKKGVKITKGCQPIDGPIELKLNLCISHITDVIKSKFQVSKANGLGGVV